MKQLFTIAKRSPRISEQLENWYTPEKIPSDPLSSKIHCQKMSCWWDVTLRRKWSNVLKAVLWIFIMLVLCLSVVTGITVAKLISVFASNIRVIAWGLGEIKDQTEATARIVGIHHHLSNLSEQQRFPQHVIRSLQDEIFEHRRSNPPVPDWFYRRNRNVQESEATN